MLTRKMISKDIATVKFAEHFATKASIKNLLKQVPNAQKISVLFEDEKYGNELLGYGNMGEKLDIVLADVFEAYTAQVAVWRSTGDNRNTVTRVSLFKDLLADRIEKKDSNNGVSTGQQIVDNLADFLKTITGKEIEDILTDAGVSNDGRDTLRMDIITWVAVRTFINKEMFPCERVVGEIIEPVSASHTISEPKVENVHDSGNDASTNSPSGKTYDIIHMKESDNGDSTITDFLEGFKKLLESEQDMTRIVNIIKSQMPMITKMISRQMNSIEYDERLILTNDNVEAVLGNYCTLDKLRIVKRIDAVKFLAYIISTVMPHSDDENLTSRLLFYIVLDVLNNPDDNTVIAEGIGFFKSLLAPMGATISAFIYHMGRLDEIVRRNFIQTVTPRGDEDDTPLTREEMVAEPEAIPTPQKRENSLDFISDALKDLHLASTHGRLHPTCR